MRAVLRSRVCTRLNLSILRRRQSEPIAEAHVDVGTFQRGVAGGAETESEQPTDMTTITLAICAGLLFTAAWSAYEAWRANH